MEYFSEQNTHSIENSSIYALLNSYLLTTHPIYFKNFQILGCQMQNQFLQRQ